MISEYLQAWMLRRNGLAKQLRKARGSMLAKDLAEQARWPGSKISKIESGKQLPTPDDLATWARLTGVDAEVREQWLAMVAEAENLRGIRRNAAAPSADIARATSFRFFDTTFVPRFLQIPEYARTVIAQHQRLRVGIGDPEGALAVHQAEVGYLYDNDRRFEFILAEPVIRWQAVDPVVMREQLDRLQSVIGARHIRLGIVPLNRRIEMFPEHSFELYDNAGVIRTFLGESLTLAADAVAKYDQIFGVLSEAAVEGGEARQLLLDASHALHND